MKLDKNTSPLQNDAEEFVAQLTSLLSPDERDKYHPRTTLRYNIAHLSPEERAHYMGLKNSRWFWEL